MKISIAERLHPFSHSPGSICLIPFSTVRVQVFPTLIRIHNFGPNSPPLYVGEVALDLNGPVKKFTVEQNLENGMIKVWGESLEGYFCYQLSANSDQTIRLKLDRFPSSKVTFSLPHKVYRMGKEHPTDTHLQTHDEVVFSFPFEFIHSHQYERLSLGFHKSQDWDLIKRRHNMGEIFPHWFRLAAITPEPVVDFKSPALEKCREAVDLRSRETLLNTFKALFSTGFEGILCPRSFDSEFQGLPALFASPSESSPVVLLTEAGKMIRSLFLQQKQDTLHLLPALPVEFHCGRATSWCCDGIGSLDFEWSKKSLRRVILYATDTKSIQFSVQNHLKSMRLRSNVSTKGERISCSSLINIQKDQFYFFDNFQH